LVTAVVAPTTGLPEPLLEPFFLVARPTTTITTTTMITPSVEPPATSTLRRRSARCWAARCAASRSLAAFLAAYLFDGRSFDRDSSRALAPSGPLATGHLSLS
jgi:hypothetical protein